MQVSIKQLVFQNLSLLNEIITLICLPPVKAVSSNPTVAIVCTNGAISVFEFYPLSVVMALKLSKIVHFFVKKSCV